MAMTPEGNRLFTRNFLLACLATVFFFASFYFLLPTLPAYVVKIGGSEAQVGLIIGIFSIASVLMRPFLGWQVDRGGRLPVMMAGAVIFVASSLMYNVARTPWSLLLLRALHGTGIAAFTTGAGALVADIAPVRRRGEAMGYYGMASSLAMAFGPALGWSVFERAGFGGVFLTSTAAALLALALSLLIREPVPPFIETVSSSARREHPLSLPDGRAKFINRAAIYPGLVMMSVCFTYGALVSFLPVYVADRQLGNVGLFFSVYAAALLLSRPVAGRVSDQWGRSAAIVPGTLGVGLGLAALAFQPHLAGLLAVAIIYGVGFGSAHPALFALAVDRAAPTQRGSAVATFGALFEVGIGLGSILMGLVLELTDFPTTFGLASLVPLLGLVVYLGAKPRR